MSGRLLAQVIITGTKIFGRAVVEAYKVAAAEASQARTAVKSDADEVTKKTGITLDEACKILNIEKNAPIEDVIKRYDILFDINDPKKGGSFYLQSKIYRAKERVEMELKKNDVEETESTNKTEDSKN